jgi:hypothetical protein
MCSAKRSSDTVVEKVIPMLRVRMYMQSYSVNKVDIIARSSIHEIETENTHPSGHSTMFRVYIPKSPPHHLKNSAYLRIKH